MGKPVPREKKKTTPYRKPCHPPQIKDLPPHNIQATKVRVYDEEWFTSDTCTIYEKSARTSSTNSEQPTPVQPTLLTSLPRHATEPATSPMSKS